MQQRARSSILGSCAGARRKEITGIEYEANCPMAEHQMRGLAEIALGKFGVTKVVIRHRIDFVPAGEASIVVRVESARRAAAFNANQWIMDELKRTVPIWKHPVFNDRNVPEGASAGKLPGGLDSSSARA
jgi:molybdopterin synthase catalytic subunit